MNFIKKTPSILTYSILGFSAGGLIWSVIHDIYMINVKKQCNNLKITEKSIFNLKLSNITNYGSFFGLLVGGLYGFTNKPLIYLLLKKSN
tara:strand:- start:159 stop:428 length:270 start_codon:yes stop_codon:yes gene_type:complete